mmetsp:Transcript_24331/g.54797  ORF Transcript_24331/g.54797 Transcript_24331/m.54797 type:complete len:260 (-) Transcript_24331:211-990(-)
MMLFPRAAALASCPELHGIRDLFYGLVPQSYETTNNNQTPKLHRSPPIVRTAFTNAIKETVNSVLGFKFLRNLLQSTGNVCVLLRISFKEINLHIGTVLLGQRKNQKHDEKDICRRQNNIQAQRQDRGKAQLPPRYNVIRRRNQRTRIHAVTALARERPIRGVTSSSCLTHGRVILAGALVPASKLKHYLQRVLAACVCRYALKRQERFCIMGVAEGHGHRLLTTRRYCHVPARSKQVLCIHLVYKDSNCLDCGYIPLG